MSPLARTLAAALLCAGFTAPVHAQAPSAPSPGQQAQALFAEYWERTAVMYPEWATYRGDHRFGDRLDDASEGSRVRWFDFAREIRAKVQALPLQQLDQQDRLSAQILARRMERTLSMEPYAGFESMSVNASPWPFQASFQDLLRAVPVDTEAQARQALARMAAYPQRVEQEIARLREGMEAGWVPARPILESALRQIDVQLSQSGRSSVYFAPFERLGRDVPAEARDRLRIEGSAAVDGQVLPAMRKLRDFVAGEYMAKAPAEGGLSRYPGGLAVYENVARLSTTTDLTPDAIHAVGLAELEKARKGMEAVRREVGFTGDMAAFTRFLNTDPRFFKRNGEEVLAGYREIIRRVEPQLPRLFAKLPRAAVGVRPLPDFMGVGAVESYDGPSLDGSRQGWFNANALAFAVRPVWGMEAIALHEAVPGHHLQIARATELAGLPAFRRAQGFTVFTEGWGLYAETLGPELGLYQDPYSRFGFHTNQAWRAVRLVVDTGLHAKGWTRQQAIAFMAEATGLERNRVEYEIDRYISAPGQALAYMVGQLKITELRDKARRALGDRFDIRRFHEAVLENGSLPLDMLEQAVDAWIALERDR